jgi:hypothetical protein
MKTSLNDSESPSTQSGLRDLKETHGYKKITGNLNLRSWLKGDVALGLSLQAYPRIGMIQFGRARSDAFEIQPTPSSRCLEDVVHVRVAVKQRDAIKGLD